MIRRSLVAWTDIDNGADDMDLFGDALINAVAAVVGHDAHQRGILLLKVIETLGRAPDPVLGDEHAGRRGGSIGDRDDHLVAVFEHATHATADVCDDRKVGEPGV